MRVNEIFYSIQGEGRFTGTAAVFIRLSGCNLRCPFCDTHHETFEEMDEEEIARRVSAFPARHVVITGGEPTLQLTPKLTQCLHDMGCYIQMETNGSKALPEGVDIDWITCSPKDAPLRIQRIDELKVLFGCQNIENLSQIKAKDYRLQPLDTGQPDDNRRILNDTLSYIAAHPKWRLSLQTHKMIHVR